MAWSTPLKLLVKRASSSQWNSDNPILNSGELGLETDTGYVKIGKGNTWSDTTYLIKPTQSMPSGIIPSNSQVGTSIEYARADHRHSFPTYDKLTQSCLSTETKFRDFALTEDYELYNNLKYDSNDKLISAEIKFPNDDVGTVFVERFGDYQEHYHFSFPDQIRYCKLIKVYNSNNKLIDKYIDNTGIIISTNLVPFSVKYGANPGKSANTGYQSIFIYKSDTKPTYISCGPKLLVSSDDDDYVSSLTITSQDDSIIYIKLNYTELGTTTDYLAISGIGCQDIVIPIDIYIGNGTSANPYPVACPAQLNDVRNGLSSYYLQLCNIALDPNTHFPAIGTFANRFIGTYDGNNYKITGFYQNNYNEDSNSTGLFGFASGSNIKNVWLWGKIEISSSISIMRAGLLNGSNSGTILNCHCYGYIKCKGTNIGGLGGLLANVSNSSAEVDIEGLSGSQYIGGLAGWIYGSSNLSGNYAKSYIHGYGTYVGGLIGYKENSNHKNENCYSQSVINMTSATAVGGFVGLDQCTQSSGNKYYSNCYANTTILGAGTKKGFCGSRVDGCTSTQTNCLWNSEISNITDDTLLPSENGLIDNKIRDNDIMKITYNYSADYWFYTTYHYPRLKWENTCYPKT